MQEKTNTVADNSACLALRVHGDKSKVLKNNAAVSRTPTILEGDGLEERNTWRRDLEAETKMMDFSWGQLERLAQGGDAWRALEGDLCSCRSQWQR